MKKKIIISIVTIVIVAGILILTCHYIRYHKISSNIEVMQVNLITRDNLEKIWNVFIKKWYSQLLQFNPKNNPRQKPSITKEIRKKYNIPERYPVTNFLPEVWVGFSPKLSKEIIGKGSIPKRKKYFVQDRISAWICDGFNKGDDFKMEVKDYIKNNELVILRVSSGEFIPDFLGEKVQRVDSVVDTLFHTAISLDLSRVVMKKEWQLP